eukprot:6444532-Ditylum_brightwellii.AAC.1
MATHEDQWVDFGGGFGGGDMANDECNESEMKGFGFHSNSANDGFNDCNDTNNGFLDNKLDDAGFGNDHTKIKDFGFQSQGANDGHGFDDGIDAKNGFLANNLDDAGFGKCNIIDEQCDQSEMEDLGFNINSATNGFNNGIENGFLGDNIDFGDGDGESKIKDFGFQNTHANIGFDKMDDAFGTQRHPRNSHRIHTI